LQAMGAAERRAFLTNYPPAKQKQILAKLREYESLGSNERELRLQVTELRYYLWPLLSAPITNRPAQLELVPAANRPLVESRLQEWDRLPVEAQKALLDNEAAVRYFSELAASTNWQKTRATLSPARQQMLRLGIERLQAMSDADRQQVVNRFNQFFDLRPAEKEKVLRTLSEAERKQMEKTLQTFGKLTRAQRSRCLTSFEKFAELSVEERSQFLKNAERWKLMKPNEREAWRELVGQAPLLPVLDSAPLPSRAPQPRPPRAGPPVATNQ
jgi:hypothetical protein